MWDLCLELSSTVIVPGITTALSLHQFRRRLKTFLFAYTHVGWEPCWFDWRYTNIWIHDITLNNNYSSATLFLTSNFRLLVRCNVPGGMVFRRNDWKLSAVFHAVIQLLFLHPYSVLRETNMHLLHKWNADAGYGWRMPHGVSSSHRIHFRLRTEEMPLFLWSVLWTCRLPSLLSGHSVYSWSSTPRSVSSLGRKKTSTPAF